MVSKAKTTNTTDPIQLMQQLGVNPSPQNYELFYTFSQSVNADLNEAMQPYVSGKQQWVTDTGSIMHNNFIADSKLQKIINDTTKDVGDELKSVMQILEQAGQNAASYEKVLEGAGGNLVDISDPRSIRDIVDHLVQETANMQNRSQDLEAKLAETNRQVEALQGNLDRVKIEAMTDSLSGLCNRKRFDEVLKQEMHQASQTNEPLALVFCDIDHFKRFNDTWGHQTGDQIIRFVSSTLKRHVSKHHIAARYGGEEFAVVMPATELSVAIDVAQNIREKIERKKLVRKSTNEDLGKVTISMGVSIFRNTDEIEEFVERADMALYQSKQNGRNRLSVEELATKGKAA